MNSASNDPPVVVNLLALPESTPTALYGLFEVFSAVGGMWRQLTGEDETARRMETRVVAREESPFASAVGPPIAPDMCLADSARSDVVIVTDLALSQDMRPGDWDVEIAWLRDQHKQGALVCSVCTGAVFLAESGLLDELEATTHWSAATLFRERYPAVRLRPERILCPAGEGHNVITSGGPGSWEDLALSRFCRKLVFATDESHAWQPHGARISNCSASDGAGLQA